MERNYIQFCEYTIDTQRECVSACALSAWKLIQPYKPAALTLITNSAGIKTAIQSIVTVNIRKRKGLLIPLQKFEFPTVLDVAMAVCSNKI